MNKTTRKLSSLMTALALVLALFSVLPEGTLKAFADDNNGAFLNSATGVLELRGQFTKEQVQAFRFNKDVLNIVAQEGAVFPKDCKSMFSRVTGDGKNKPWPNVDTIDLRKADASQAETFMFMFEDSCCKHVNMSGLYAPKLESMGAMFKNNVDLVSADLSNIKAPALKRMFNLFYGCKSLKSFDLRGFDTSKVTSMSGMFEHCESIETIDLTCLDVSSAESLARMFDFCENLKSVDISTFYAPNITSLNCMFEGCNKLSDIKFPNNMGTSKLKTAEYMFAWCFNLKSLDLSFLDTSNVTNMSSMFFMATQLSDLDLSGFNTEKVTDMSQMFDNCHSLRALDISSFDTRNVTDMTEMFYGSEHLVRIYVGSKWDVSKAIGKSDNMFAANTHLVGHNGYKYELKGNKTAEYACVDTESKHGFLSIKAKYLPGDVNGDGMVTSDDAVITARMAAGYGNDKYVYSYDVFSADVNKDDMITADDAIIIARIAADYGDYKYLYTV